MSTAATKTAPEVLVVTADELTSLAEAEKAYTKAKEKLSAAEGDVKRLRLQLAEKVLGIKTEDEWKMLDPKAVEKKMARRLEAGDWQLGRGAPQFSFVVSNKGRYPAWRKLFALELGESAAAKVTDETDYQYSYRVDVVPA